MRLLFVIYGSIDQISGGYIYDRKVVEYLRSQGDRVDILSLRPLPYLFSLVQGSDPRLHRVLNTRAAEYDAVVVDELVHPTVFRTVARRNSPTPVLVLVHHLRSSERGGGAPQLLVRAVSRLIEHRLLNSADGIIVNSETTACSVEALLDRRLPIWICKPGCDGLSHQGGGSRGRRPDAEGRIRLLITGSVIPRKGHGGLIRVLAGCMDLDWRLSIVGESSDSSYRRRLDRLIRRFGMEQRIFWLGCLCGEALAEEYREADLFVFPSQYEGYGISLAEALFAGLPVLTFSVGAIPEVVRDPAMLIPEKDFEEFKRRLRSFVQDGTFRKKLLENARKLGSVLSPWRESVQAFRDILIHATGVKDGY